MSSPLQHHANCLQTIHKTIQQFNQHLKAKHLDRQTWQLIVLQLQNDFAILLFLLISPLKQSPTRILLLRNSTTSPLFNSNHNPVPNPTSSALPLPCTDGAKLRRSTPVGAVDHPERKQTNMQTPISSPHPTRRKLLQLRCRTSLQEIPNWKNYLQMK